MACIQTVKSLNTTKSPKTNTTDYLQLQTTTGARTSHSLENPAKLIAWSTIDMEFRKKWILGYTRLEIWRKIGLSGD